jgi:hypothetical protein
MTTHTRQAELRKYRVVLGFLLGPLVPGLLIGILIVIQHGPLQSIGFCIWLAALLGYPIAVVFGVPLFLLMRRLNWIQMYYYALIGPILGVVSVALYCVYSRPTYAWPTDWFVKGAFMGVLATVSFWLIVRPDLSGHCEELRGQLSASKSGERDSANKRQ